MIVHKFGGTSVGDAAGFSRVAAILKERSSKDGGTVAVVSAMSGITNSLISGARASAEGKEQEFLETCAHVRDRHLEAAALILEGEERERAEDRIEKSARELGRLLHSISVLGELTLRGCDAVASFGEQLSAALLASALRSRGVPSEHLSATELIVTDEKHGGASPLAAPTGERLRSKVIPLLNNGSVPVITGFIGATAKGVTTTLGRGGGDYSAAIAGAGLHADGVWIWSDVDGILTADPNIVPSARTIPELSHDEAAILANFGAEVLHPKTVAPVSANRVPMRLLNTFRPEREGTRIVAEPGTDRKTPAAIISSRGLNRIAVSSAGGDCSHSWASSALNRVSEAGIDILMFSRSFSERSMSLIVREQDRGHCVKELSGHGRLPGGKGDYEVDVLENVATVSVVGLGKNGSPGFVGRSFETIGRHRTRIIAVTQSPSQDSVSFCIPEEQLEGTVRSLHEELGLGGTDE